MKFLKVYDSTFLCYINADKVTNFNILISPTDKFYVSTLADTTVYRVSPYFDNQSHVENYLINLIKNLSDEGLLEEEEDEQLTTCSELPNELIEKIIFHKNEKILLMNNGMNHINAVLKYLRELIEKS